MPNPRGHRNPAAGHLTIAPTVSIDSNCTIPDAPVADVTIGNCVNIGPNVTIISVHHSKTVSERSERLMYAENVTIGDYAWIGAGAAILPGVKVGKHSIIKAGSVVVKDIPDNSIAVGRPAQVQGQVPEKVIKAPRVILGPLREALGITPRTSRGISKQRRSKAKDKPRVTARVSRARQTGRTKRERRSIHEARAKGLVHLAKLMQNDGAENLEMVI